MPLEGYEPPPHYSSDQDLLLGVDEMFTQFLQQHQSERPCRTSGEQSPASHRLVAGSIPGQVIWDLLWTKWHWGGFSLHTSVSPANPHFTNSSIFIPVIDSM
jgi:hypothetical protein